MSGEGVGAGERAAAQSQGHRENGRAVGDRRGVEGDHGFVLLVFVVVTHRQGAGGGVRGIERAAGVGGLGRLQHPAVLGGDGGEGRGDRTRHDLRRRAVVAAAVRPAGGAGEGGGESMAAPRQSRSAEGGIAGAVDGDAGGQGGGSFLEGDGAGGHAGAGGHGRRKRDRLSGRRGVGRGAQRGGGDDRAAILRLQARRRVRAARVFEQVE